MTTLTKLADTPLRSTPQDLWRLFEPFVATDSNEAAWRSEARRRKLKLLRRFFKLRQLRGQAVARSGETVRAEYERSWARTADYPYSIEHFPKDFTPWIGFGREVLASDVGATRFRQELLISVIEQTRPTSVLEIGCGNGINLMLLACRFPEIRFCGLELTAAGVRAARAFQDSQASLPEEIVAYAPRTLADTRGFKRVDFIRGDATAAPFPDGAFDLVFTSLALEQMEQLREQALREMARVAGSWVFNVEPFADVNTGFWSKLYVAQRGYFRGSIADLRRHGLQPEWATMDFPQELFLKACAVLSRKRG